MFADPPELTAAPPPPRPARLWRWRDLAAGVVVMLVAFFGVLAALVVLRSDAFLPSFLGTLSFELTLAVIVLVIARRRGVSLGGLGFAPPTSWWAVVGAWFGAYGIMGVYGIALEVLRQFGLDVERFTGGNPLPVGRDAPIGELVAMGALVVGVAPFAEELFFRAFLFRGLRGYWSLLAAALVSGLAFSLFHGVLAVIVPFALIGALFAWSFEKSGSLWTSIVAHTLVNGLSFLVSLAVVDR